MTMSGTFGLLVQIGGRMRSYLPLIFILATGVIAQAQTSRSAKSYLERGNSFYAGGQRAEALADYDIAIKFNPGWAVPYHNRGLARVNLDPGLKPLVDRFRKSRRSAKAGGSQ